MRQTSDIESALNLHGAAVWRMCVLHFSSGCDAQDAYQETFLKYAIAEKASFESEEHRKAWLLRVAANTCKDMLRSAARKNIPLDENSLAKTESTDPSVHPGSFRSEVIDIIRDMDDPPRTPLYLALVEEYPATEIAGIVNAPVNTVYSWISRGKKLLKEALR